MSYSKFVLSLCFIVVSVVAIGQKKETRSVGSFTEISLGISANVYLKQGNTIHLELEGYEEDLQKIITEVDGDRLRIKHDGKWFGGWKQEKVNIYITMPIIEGLSVSGSGDIVGEGKFKSNHLDLSISGSGDIDLDIETGDVEVSISGSGDIKLAGKCDLVDVRISGSGKFDAREMVAKSCEIKIAGSGTCYVHATESIESKVSGSGDIYYLGDPKQVNNSSAGSGKIKKM